MRKPALLLVCLLTFAGCASSPSEPPPKQKTPLETALDEERYYELGEWGEGRVKIRQAATDYLKAKDPDVKIAGISVQRFDPNCYLVWVDGGQERVERLVVKLYVKDSGETYWKAEPYDYYMKLGAGGLLRGKQAVLDEEKEKQRP